jgi:hypothetical protein
MEVPMFVVFCQGREIYRVETPDEIEKIFLCFVDLPSRTIVLF